MAAHEKMPTYRLLFTITFAAYSIQASQISDLKLCADKNCKGTISRAAAIARYPASSPLHLSFNRDDIIEIKSKSAGNRPELWSGEVNGRTGYFPRAFVKEFEVFHDYPTFEVPTEENKWVKQNQKIPLPTSSSETHNAVRSAEEKLEVKKETMSESDETEIEENTLTGDRGAASESAISGVNQPAADLQREKRAQGEDETEIEEDNAVFNEFLAKRFGTDQGDSASKQEMQDTIPPQKNLTIDKSEQENVASKFAPEVVEAVDDTEVNEEFELLYKVTDGQDKRPPKAGNDIQDHKDIYNTVADMNQEKKVKSDSSYIDGITVLDVEEAEENEDSVIDESMAKAFYTSLDSEIERTLIDLDKENENVLDVESSPAILKTIKENEPMELKDSGDDNLKEMVKILNSESPETKEELKSGELDIDALGNKLEEPNIAVTDTQSIHENWKNDQETLEIPGATAKTLEKMSAEIDKSGSAFTPLKDNRHAGIRETTVSDVYFEPEEKPLLNDVLADESNIDVSHLHAESDAKRTHEQHGTPELGNKNEKNLVGKDESRHVDQNQVRKEPLVQIVKGHEPVNIDLIHSVAQTRSPNLVLESSQVLPNQESQMETPGLEDVSSQHGSKAVETHKTKEAFTISPEPDGQKILTTVMDGTTLYLEDDGILDLISESKVVTDFGVPASTAMSVPPDDMPVVEVEPTVSTLTEEIPGQVSPNIPAPHAVHLGAKQNIEGNQNKTDSTPSAGSPVKSEQLDIAVDERQPSPGGEKYHTNADFLGRKVLSVDQSGNQRVPVREERIETGNSEEIKGEATAPSEVNGAQPGFRESSVVPETLTSAGTLPSQILPTPPAMPDFAATAVTESQPEHKKEEQRPESADSVEDKTAPQPVPNLDAATYLDAQSPDSIPSLVTGDQIPSPPSADNVYDQEIQVPEEPTLESDTYQMDDYYSRKITDEEIAKAEEELTAYASESSSSSVMTILEVQSKAFIDKLPPSIQSLLEQEPMGMSPAMTVLVTMTTFVIFSLTLCFSCICTRPKKSGKKDPLVVVRELEEKLLMAVKEKENLEDLVQEHQSEGNRLKDELKVLQMSTGSSHTELQNVKLHNEALKSQVTTLQSEITELKDHMSQKSDDVKVKDKKTKDLEKVIKKLQETIKNLEQENRKKEEDRLNLEQENKESSTKIQSMTDRLQKLETSKQQLLLEADDWKEKVEEMKERLEQLELENKQAQESMSFKDNELEVMKDCYLQLKAFEKESVDGVEEFDPASTSDIQEKIQAMMDVSRVNATLRAVQEEKDSLENKLKIENDARHELEEQLECVRREAESCMADKMKAERQCQEAQTKLSVLSGYFKEKELQLQRELGEHEALRKQNLSKLDSADETTRSMHKELEMCKQQVESLKRELAASERDFRTQIAANEKKAHENWLNARAAERELKEARHEAAVLRQKLTEVERRQMGPGGLIRPLPTRVMPLPGMLNGPPPPPPPPHPGMERSPSRGSLPSGPPLPPFRDDDFNVSPRDRQRLPPSHPALHMPPPPDIRPAGPRMPPPEARSPPPRMPPPDGRSPPPRIPPPYDRRSLPHPMDRASPPLRLPPQEMRGHLPPHIRSPPRSDSPRDARPGPSPYGRPGPGSERRHQSQV
ncbi:transport and Golgi organization protein 1 homolog isoform X2 [Pomacea canaliculata]|uniref:transport and Golgi organization protein 1 homolog isoform X2 n=1 Tax=Pomacea canaliculata TaxID=400727 RepID=UPI000D73C9EA|nr:transport and Golgi organization protein 1 homolog isoform X2 [Pomacea canaliculata]